MAKTMKQNIDPEKIAASLAVEIQTDELTSHERRVWLDRVTEIMREPGPEEVAFFVARAKRDNRR